MTDTNIIRCGHCHKQGGLELRTEGSQDNIKVDENYHDGQDIIAWRVLECIYCQKPTLEEVKRVYKFVTDDVYGEQKLKSSESKILYPTSHVSLTSLPKLIENRYKEALKVREVSADAFVVMAG